MRAHTPYQPAGAANTMSTLPVLRGGDFLVGRAFDGLDFGLDVLAFATVADGHFVARLGGVEHADYVHRVGHDLAAE